MEINKIIESYNYKKILVKEYVENYVYPEEYLNFNERSKKRSSFKNIEEVYDFWSGYDYIYIFGKKIKFEDESSVLKIKQIMGRDLLVLEKEIDDSYAICLHKDRYSLEELGANVGLTCRKLMGYELEWFCENEKPNYFYLINALLIKGKMIKN